MHRFNVSFTKTRAQLVEIELADPQSLLRVGKRLQDSAWTLCSNGELELRVFGRFVLAELVALPLGLTEGDVLAQLEERCREVAIHGHPKLVVIRADTLRGFVGLPFFPDPDFSNIPDCYTLSLPPLGLL